MAHGLQRLLLKLNGRVAEYVMLTLTPPERDRDDSIWVYFSRLDGVILGDQVLVTQRSVKSLTTLSRGSTKMEQFLTDFQLKAELVLSLGKHIDADVLGTMLLDRSNLSDLDRRLIMAATRRSVDYGQVLTAMRLHFMEDSKGEAFEARVGEADTQEAFG